MQMALETPTLFETAIPIIGGLAGGFAFMSTARTKSRYKRVLGLFLCMIVGYFFGGPTGRWLTHQMPDIFAAEDPLLVGIGAFLSAAIMPLIYNAGAAVFHSIENDPRDIAEFLLNAWLSFRGKRQVNKREEDYYGYEEEEYRHGGIEEDIPENFDPESRFRRRTRQGR